MWIVRGNTERFHVSFTHCPLPLYHIMQNFIDNVTTMILTWYNQERRYFHLLKDPSCWPIIPTSLTSHPDPLLNAPPQLLCNVFSTSVIMSSQIRQINGIVHYEKKKKNNQKETLQIRNTIREIKSYLDGLKNRVKGTLKKSVTWKVKQ